MCPVFKNLEKDILQQFFNSVGFELGFPILNDPNQPASMHKRGAATIVPDRLAILDGITGNN